MLELPKKQKNKKPKEQISFDKPKAFTNKQTLNLVLFTTFRLIIFILKFLIDSRLLAIVFASRGYLTNLTDKPKEVASNVFWNTICPVVFNFDHCHLDVVYLRWYSFNIEER